MFKALKERFLCLWWQVCYKHRRPNFGFKLGCDSCCQEHNVRRSARWARERAERERIYKSLGVQ